MDGEEKILEEITAGGLPSHVSAEIVSPPPVLCGQNYVAGSKVFPEKCSLPVGHLPRSSTSNHYAFGLGWWA